MASKAFKSAKIQEITESISKAKVAFITDYRGLTVAEITDLRRQLQKEEADCAVIKNTLAKIAIKDTPYEGLEQFLQGPSAIILGFNDQVAPAKILTQYIKKAKKTELKGGVIDGKVLTANEVQKLSELPSKDELYAKMLGSINSPASGLVNTVSGVMRALTIAMEQVRKQKEANA
ncbi:MAG: 50S ribosomal protein L10 [Bacillus subtilis]|nr:50S ribosomal protein L10 [Bacillus subtilis]